MCDNPYCETDLSQKNYKKYPFWQQNNARSETRIDQHGLSTMYEPKSAKVLNKK